MSTCRGSGDAAGLGESVTLLMLSDFGRTLPMMRAVA
jgi:hypothetical protein